MFNDSGYHVDAWWRGKLVEECQVYINTNQAITLFLKGIQGKKENSMWWIIDGPSDGVDFVCL